MKWYVVGLAILLIASCCQDEAQQSETSAQEISYCELAKAPQSYSGKRIRVRAIFRYGFEIQQLDPPVCCAESAARIWVQMDSELRGDSLKLSRKFPKGMGLALATFVGSFEANGPYGDGRYRFKFTVDHIEKLEGTAKPSPSHLPAWVPQDCGKSGAMPNQTNLPHCSP